MCLNDKPFLCTFGFVRLIVAYKQAEKNHVSFSFCSISIKLKGSLSLVTLFFSVTYLIEYFICISEQI